MTETGDRLRGSNGVREGGLFQYVTFLFALLSLVGASFALWTMFSVPQVAQRDLSNRMEEAFKRMDRLETFVSQTAQEVGALSMRTQTMEQWGEKFKASEKTDKDMLEAQKILQANVEQIRSVVAKLDQGQSSTDGAVNGSNSGITARLQALEDRISALRSAASSGSGSDKGPVQGALQDRISEMDKHVTQMTANLRTETSEIDRRIQTVSAAQNAASLVIASYSLMNEIEAGRPYVTSLTAIEALNVEPSELIVLRAYADQGVASPRLLSDLFMPLALPILAGESSEDVGGVWDRMLKGVSQFVKIRPVGPTRGVAVEDLVARIGDYLNKGQVSKALEAYDQLPARAKSLAQPWAMRARAYLQVSESAHELLLNALGKLAKTKL